MKETSDTRTLNGGVGGCGLWIVSVAEVTPFEKRVSEVLSLDALSSAEPFLCFLRRRKHLIVATEFNEK